MLHPSFTFHSRLQFFLLLLFAHSETLGALSKLSKSSVVTEISPSTHRVVLDIANSLRTTPLSSIPVLSSIIEKESDEEELNIKSPENNTSSSINNPVLYHLTSDSRALNVLANIDDGVGNASLSVVDHSPKTDGVYSSNESATRGSDSGFADLEIPTGSDEVRLLGGKLHPVGRGDTNSDEDSQNLEYLAPVQHDKEETHPTQVSYVNSSTLSSMAPPVIGASQIGHNTMSWLDAFMYQHRDSLWILFNTSFMVIWILLGGLSLYRLLGLPWCSLYLSRTQYLVIHLLIFTAATFAFVQLVHLSYGSHEGLPLFLTLLLTHTPTPCLAVSVIIMTYCILVSARLPILGRYSPPLIYVGILVAFIIVLSFVGDIIVGVSRNSAVLIVCRVCLTAFCLFCMITYIFNYKKIVGIALILRREFRGELKSLAIPLESPEESHDGKLHLKKVLLTWTRVTLVSCFSGVLMCLFSFCLSLFFTVSFVPLWAFWVLHSCIFATQLTVVISLTFGAAFTLTYSSRRNIFYKYFFPSLPNSSSSDGSFIKRGNFIYQRVSLVNGPAISQVVSSGLSEREEQLPFRNNNLMTPYRGKPNLKRSATFNCPPPYGFQGLGPPCASNLYPVLSDHILSYPNSQFCDDFAEQAVVGDTANVEPYYKPLHVTNSFTYATTERRKYHHYNHGRRYPMRSFQSPDKFSSFSSISNTSGIHRRSLAASPVSPTNAKGDPPLSYNLGLAGTVETLEVRHPSSISVPVPVPPPKIDDKLPSRVPSRQIPPYSNSFSNVDRSRFLKLEPPEKPARRTEPIFIESGKTLPTRDAADDDDINLNFGSIALNVHSPVTLSVSRDGKNTFPNSLGRSSPMGITNFGLPSSPLSFTTNDSSPCSLKYVTPKYSEPTSPLYPTQFKSIDSNGRELHNPSLHVNVEMGSGSSRPKKAFGQNTLESADNAIQPAQEDIALYAEPSTLLAESSTTTTGLSSCDGPENCSAELETSSVQSPKRQSLKRNHSTAGDLTPSYKSAESHPTDPIDAVNNQYTNSLKYPWYGTWGGRRKSKRDSITGEVSSSSSGFNLRRLSSSKSSLTSLYEKLKKPKRSGRWNETRNPTQENGLSDGTAEEGLFASDNTNDDERVNEEEEEDFLPRLDEDIDLAADIFQSSTVLANFYSLKRSDLKKRKLHHGEAEGDEDGEGSEVACDEGNASDYKDANSSLIATDDNDQTSKKSLTVDTISDNT